MNYFLLAETDFFRQINEAGDCNMEKAYTAFATQVIELCIGSPDTNRTIIALAYIEIELQHHPVRNLPEEKKEIANYVSKALSFVRKMQKFLAAPQVPPLTSNIQPTIVPSAKSETQKSLQWTGNTLDLVELIYGLSEMGCIDNGETPLKVLAPALYEFFGLDTKECYRYYSAIKLRKNPSRTYFIDKMQKKLNEKIRRDEELERMRR
ncbi:RteC domain-containing protein [Bacteroides heparinolyticus]|uniref:RteC domain-containing protein n=1 Tax=Prevotella heparinolytica TaxID=28113 RepID=UPI0035A13F44